MGGSCANGRSGRQTSQEVTHQKLNLTTHYMNNEQFEAIERGDRLLINGAWYEAGIAVTRAARELRRAKDGARMWLKRRFRGGAFVLELQAANPVRK